MVFTIFSLINPSPINAIHYLFIYFHYHPIINLAHYLLISRHCSIFFQFFSNFFNIYFFFLIFSLTPTFLPPLAFHLPTTIYFDITLHLSFHLLLFCLFLFTTFHYKFVILFHSLHSFFSIKKGYFSLSLSLSLSLC